MTEELPATRNESFSVLDKHVGNSKKVAVAFSGGKDSTALALLLLDWIMERGRSDISVTLVHSDTLSEIPEMEMWSRKFMEAYRDLARSMGVRADFIVTKPVPIDTFYWRVLIRGYVAPTFSFRWCVELLKRMPSREALKRVGSALVLLGHRDEESSARAASLARRGMMCPLTAGRCSSYYFNVEGNSIRIYPIRSWTATQVWDYLRDWRKKIDLDDLFKLYMDGAMPARYGCWHCTLVKRQLGHYILGDNHMYFEAARLLYRWISDLPWMRIPKDRGYSKLGPLTPTARAIIAKLILTAEKLSGIKLYGLDESKLEDYTLRQILFEIPENEANKIIRKVEAIHIKKDPQRFVDIESIRDMGRYREQVLKFMEYVNGKHRSKKERMKLEELEEYINTMTDNLLE